MGFDTAIQAVALAWITRRLPPEVHTLRFPYYPHRSIKELSWAIRRPVRGFGQSEVLASNLLAWLSYSGCNETDAHLHFAGSLGILLYLLELQDPSSRRGKGPTGDLTTYGPFIIDCANAWATRNGGTPTRSTTFAQRVDYFDNLFQVTSTENIWYSGILEAGNATLGNLMEISLRTVLDLVRLEAQGRNTRFGLEATEHYIRAELGDPDLQAGLQAIFRTFQGLGTDHTTVEGQLITRIFHRLRCVLLCLSILESPAVQFRSDDSKSTISRQNRHFILPKTSHSTGRSN